MAAFSGTAGSVVLYGTAGTVVVGMSEWSLNASMSPVESSEFGDQWEEYVPSLRNASGSFSGNRDQTAAQSTLITAFLAGSSVVLRLHETSSTYWAGTAYMTSMSPSLSHSGKGEMSFDFQVTGAITYN